MDNEEKAGLIVCSPEMYKHLESMSNGEMPPKEAFVISGVIHPEIAFVVARDDFFDWLDAHGTAWTM